MEERGGREGGGQEGEGLAPPAAATPARRAAALKPAARLPSLFSRSAAVGTCDRPVPKTGTTAELRGCEF